MTPLPHPLCRHFASKKLYMLPTDEPLTLEALTGGSAQQYWCLQTFTGNGPDGDWVNYPQCSPGRGCYQPGEGHPLAGVDGPPTLPSA